MKADTSFHALGVIYSLLRYVCRFRQPSITHLSWDLRQERKKRNLPASFSNDEVLLTRNSSLWEGKFTATRMRADILESGKKEKQKQKREQKKKAEWLSSELVANKISTSEFLLFSLFILFQCLVSAILVQFSCSKCLSFVRFRLFLFYLSSCSLFRSFAFLWLSSLSLLHTCNFSLGFDQRLSHILVFLLQHAWVWLAPPLINRKYGHLPVQMIEMRGEAILMRSEAGEVLVVFLSFMWCFFLLCFPPLLLASLLSAFFLSHFFVFSFLAFCLLCRVQMFEVPVSLDLPPVHPSSLVGVANMTALSELTEAAILQTLRVRYGRNDIYVGMDG